MALAFTKAPPAYGNLGRTEDRLTPRLSTPMSFPACSPTRSVAGFNSVESVMA